MKIEIHGYASVKADVRTVGDLRELVKWLDRYLVESEKEVDAQGHLWLTLADTNDGATAEMIECGDHVPPAVRYDVVINTHDHPKPEAESDRPKYDWMSIDKYATVWDGLPE